MQNGRRSAESADRRAQSPDTIHVRRQKVFKVEPADGSGTVDYRGASGHASGERILSSQTAVHMFGRRMMDQPDSLPTPEQAVDEDFDLKSLMKRPARPAR